jgi:hypothetical protein
MALFMGPSINRYPAGATILSFWNPIVTSRGSDLAVTKAANTESTKEDHIL